MTEKEVAEFNKSLPPHLRAELLPNGLVRVFDYKTKMDACYDGETGVKRFGALFPIDLTEMLMNREAR